MAKIPRINLHDNDREPTDEELEQIMEEAADKVREQSRRLEQLRAERVNNAAVADKSLEATANAQPVTGCGSSDPELKK